MATSNSPSTDEKEKEAKKMMEEIVKQCGLTMEACDKKISKTHIQEISECYCENWRLLPCHLKMPLITVKDVERDKQNEKERRHLFFSRWEEKKGSDATYKTLIHSLLLISSRDDAEEICKMIPCKETKEAVPCCSRPPSTGASNSTATTDPSDREASNFYGLPPAIYGDLKQQLITNYERIGEQYASYVSRIRLSLEKERISVDELRTHLINLPAFKHNHDSKELRLLSGRAVDFETAENNNALFRILSSECCWFLDFTIFQSIVRNYDLDKGEEEFKYPEFVKKYINDHNIKEFMSINPKLSGKLSDDSEILVLKFDIALTSKLSKVFELKIAIAKILGVQSSALQLLDIQEGCVVVSFSIPSNVAAVINNDIFTQHEEEFENLSVLWLEFKSQRFKFTTKKADSLITFLEKHQISAKALMKKIDGSHLQEIIDKSCKNWRNLQPHLGAIKFEDAIKFESKKESIADEGEIRKSFFQEWSKTWGRGANYFKLVSALLKSNSQEDALFVCSLLQDCATADSSPAASGDFVPFQAKIPQAIGNFFGQRRPPLSVIIQQILQKYPDGQIFKELIQNADDAGATRIQFYLDFRQHESENLVHPALKAYQGPALISANDAMFSEQDWEGIQSLQQSVKAENPFKVGRFGIGFNSVYHLTGIKYIQCEVSEH